VRKKILALLCSLCLFGCDPQFFEQQSETLSEGAYAIPAAIEKGRIDQADNLAHSLTSFIQAPKKPLTENAIIDPSTGALDIILPAGLSGNVIVVGTQAYSDLLKNKNVASELAQSQKDAKTFQTQANQQKANDLQVQNAMLSQIDSLNKQIADWKQSIFYKAYVFFHALPWFLGGSVIIIIVVCIFFPPLVAPIMTFLGEVVGFIVSGIQKLLSLL